MNISQINSIIKAELLKERGYSTDYKEHIRILFKLCRDSIHRLSNRSFQEELPLDTSRKELDREILNSTNALLKAYNHYSDGKLSSAIATMRNRFLTKGVIKTYTLKTGQDWFRARRSAKKGDGFKPEEMFHIPFDRRTDVVNYRFSISGYPCLYIGNTLLSCWEEMHCPPLYDFVVSKVSIKEGKSIKVLDLRVPEQVSAEKVVDDKEREKNLMLLKTWPLIIACSIKTLTPDSTFKYEYIHPQLLMLAMKEEDNDLYGVAYTSTHIDPNMFTELSRYTNVAIPVRKAESKGYCKELAEVFELTRGISYMEAEIKNVFDMANRFSIDKNGILCMTTYRDGSAPYEFTKFGQLEEFLKEVEFCSIVNSKKRKHSI